MRCGILGGGRSSWALLLLALGGGVRVAVCKSVHLACVALLIRELCFDSKESIFNCKQNITGMMHLKTRFNIQQRYTVFVFLLSASEYTAMCFL